MIARRFLAALAPAGAAFLFGVALGERGELGIVQYLFLAGIPAAVAVMAWYAKKARRGVIVIGLAMVAGLLIGQRAFARAYDDCVARGAIVRDAIERYADQHGEYPARLRDLPIEDMPCSCLLRGTILHYFANERGYRLWFTNDFETIALTHRRKAAALPPQSKPTPRVWTAVAKPPLC